MGAEFRKLILKRKLDELPVAIYNWIDQDGLNRRICKGSFNKFISGPFISSDHKLRSPFRRCRNFDVPIFHSRKQPILFSRKPRKTASIC